MSVFSIFKGNNDEYLVDFEADKAGKVDNSNANVVANSNANSNANSDDSKAGAIAYEIFGMVPVVGTFIGIHHMYKAITSDKEVKSREILKIFIQIFSFLILPQIIFLVGCGISDCISRRHSQYEFVILDDTADNPKIDIAGDNNKWVDL